jgi:hypothetical protein
MKTQDNEEVRRLLNCVNVTAKYALAELDIILDLLKEGEILDATHMVEKVDASFYKARKALFDARIDVDKLRKSLDKHVAHCLNPIAKTAPKSAKKGRGTVNLKEVGEKMLENKKSIRAGGNADFVIPKGLKKKVSDEYDERVVTEEEPNWVKLRQPGGDEWVEYKILTDDNENKYLSYLRKSVELEDSKWKGAGCVAYREFFLAHKNEPIVIDTELTDAGIAVLERLSKEGLVYKTNAKVVKIGTDTNCMPKYYYDKPLYKYNFKWKPQKNTSHSTISRKKPNTDKS